jgi:hypothetical protein
MPSVLLQHRQFRFRLATALLCFFAAAAFGQEAFRVSQAGDAAAEARKLAIANTAYNVKAGALKLRFHSGMSVEYTDNVNATHQNAQSDMSFSPQFNVTASMPVSTHNQLAFSIGAGYAYYLKTSRLNHLFITPDTDTEFDIGIGDFTINFHNRMTLSQDSYSQTESGTANAGYFEDTAGVRVNWDLNRLRFSLGLDHQSYSATTTGFEYRDHGTEIINLIAEFFVNQNFRVGLQLGSSMTAYDLKPAFTNMTVITATTTNIVPVASTVALNDQRSFNFGPFAQAQLSPFLSVKVSAGYTTIFVDSSGTAAGAGTSGGSLGAFYGDLTVAHKVSRLFSYDMSFGRQIQLGLFSNSLDLLYARFTPRFNHIRKVELTMPIAYEHAEQSSGTTTAGEILDRYTFGLEAAFQISRKLDSRVGYYYSTKLSSIPAGSYVQNRLVFDLNYRF